MKIFFTTLSCFLSLQIMAQKVRLIDESPLTDEGLFFEGKKGVDYQFGKQITPHGNCIDVINGYVFVTWYKGGMEHRNLMVSRKKVDGDTWQTIEFPYKHVGFRGDPTKGDSHNRAAIRICPINNTVHIVYDLHAYRKEQLPNRYFNYIVSKDNTSFGEKWDLSIFNENRNYLKEGDDYERLTYPEFNRFDDGRIMLDVRFGGSGNGNDLFAIYDGKTWSSFNKYNDGNQEMKYNFYGSFQFLHGKLYQGACIRYMKANRDDNFKYDLNSGLYFAVANAPFGLEDWSDINGKTVKIPIQNPDVIKVAEPCDIDPKNNRISNMKWTVSKAGDVHYFTKVGDTPVHYYKKSNGTKFEYSTDCPHIKGDVFAYGKSIFAVALENGRPVIKSTKAGTNDWSVLYKQNKGDTYRHCVVIQEGNKIFLYAMKKGKSKGKAQPISLLTFNIK